MKRNKLNSKDIVIAAALIAIGIICANSFPYGFTFYSPDKSMKFSPVFIILALAGTKFNFAICGVISTAIDVMQALLSSNTPNPIIMLSSFLTGIIFGLFFSGKINMIKTLSCILFTQLFCSMVITTYGIWLYYKTPIEILLVSRSIQTVIYIVVEIICLPALFIKADLPKKIKLVK